MAAAESVDGGILAICCVGCITAIGNYCLFYKACGSSSSTNAGCGGSRGCCGSCFAKDFDDNFVLDQEEEEEQEKRKKAAKTRKAMKQAEVKKTAKSEAGAETPGEVSSASTPPPLITIQPPSSQGMTPGVAETVTSAQAEPPATAAVQEDKKEIAEMNSERKT